MPVPVAAVAANSTAQSKKRARGGASVVDRDECMRIRFDELRALRQFVDIVQCMLTRVKFLVKRSASDDDGTIHLSVDTMDPRQVCVVQGLVECRGELAEETTFCVDTKDLKLCLKSVYSHEYIVLVSYREKTNIHLFVHDIVKGTERIRFSLSTFDEDRAPCELAPLQYDLLIEVSIVELRRNLKMSKDFGAEDVCFTVYRKKDDASTSMVTISSKGSSEYYCRLMTTSKQNEEDASVTTASGRGGSGVDGASSASSGSVDEEEFDCIFRARFGLVYLNDFLHAMENEFLVMKLDQNNPLVIEYDLGITATKKNLVRMIMAPYVDEGASA